MKSSGKCPSFWKNQPVSGLGETGLHKSTQNEIDALQAHVEIAIKHDQLVLIHTPHLADKAHGTKTVLEVLAGMDVNPDKIWIDHVEEQTIESVLDAGYWAGMTLYPVTKCSPRRSVDIFENILDERFLVNSSADWGPSDPFTLQESLWNSAGVDTAYRKQWRFITTIPCRFLGQNPKWDIKPHYHFRRVGEWS